MGTIKYIRFCPAKEIIKKKKKKNNLKDNRQNGKNVRKWCDTQGLNLQNIQTAHTTQQEQKQTSQLKNIQRP